MSRLRHDHQHASEDIIDLESMPPEPIDVSGGAQTVSLLGPFPIAFDTPNLVNPDDNGYELAGSDLADGTIVLVVWGELGDDWVGAPPIVMDISIGASASGTPFCSVLLTAASGGPHTHSTFNLQGTADHTFDPILPKRVDGSGAKIVCAAYTDDSAPASAGSGSVYAIVATQS